MSSGRKYRNYTLAIVCAFAIISILATIKPTFVDEEIIQSLTFPTFLLSIIASLQLVVENALQLCNTEYDYAFEGIKRLESLVSGAKIIDQDIAETVFTLSEPYKEELARLQYDKNVYKKTGRKIIKHCSILNIIETVALVIFLLSAFLRFSLITVDETIIAYWSLTIMLLSSCFSSIISTRYFDYVADKIDKHEEKSIYKEKL